MGHSLFCEHSFKCSKCITSRIIPLAPFYKRNTEAQESKLFPLTYVIVVDPRHELKEFGSEVFSCNHNVILPTGDVSNKDFPAPQNCFPSSTTGCIWAAAFTTNTYMMLGCLLKYLGPVVLDILIYFHIAHITWGYLLYLRLILREDNLYQSFILFFISVNI